MAGKTIGLDYQSTSIENQMELLFSIKTGSFPLFVPGFAGDHSSSALTLGEVYHPLPHIASLMPGYWDGKALQWNTFWRLMSLGLTHLVLFTFLRRLNINMLFSFLLSVITVYNLRMLDLFRYGASLESYTAHLLLCASIGFHYIKPSRWLGPISIIGSTYLLICSGHPQMMYYGLIGAVLVLLAMPFFISSMLPDRCIALKTVRRFWLQAGLYIGLGILLSTAYTLPFYFDFIATNTGRVGQGYGWADSIKDTFIGTLNNFFMPFRSDVHGAFGGSALIITAALLPMLKCFRVKIPRPVWAVWGIALFVFLYMQGARTPVHRLIWENLPFASSFRYAGRISIMMPVLLMLVLAWIVKAEDVSFRFRGRTVILAPFRIMALTALLAASAYYVLVIVSYAYGHSFMLEFSPFTPVTIRDISRPVELSVLLLGITSLLTLSVYDPEKRTAKVLGILLSIITCLQIGGVLTFGTWVEDRLQQPTFNQMQAEKRSKLAYRFYPGTGMYSSTVVKQQSNSFMEPFMGKIYHDVIPVSSQDDVYERMLQGRTPQQIFIQAFETESDFSLPGELEVEKSRVKLIYSSFNVLRFRVFSPVPALFGMPYSYTGHWNALVNDQPVPVFRANGAAHATRIPKGESLLEFQYMSPAGFWGMIISCLTLAVTGLFLCFMYLAGLQRTLSVITVLVASAGIFTFWHQSLYTGDNLGTEYSWTYSPPKTTPNLAYGKRTLMSSSFRGSPGYLHSSRAIDGDLGPNSGFATHHPSWTVDLNAIVKIKTIILHESVNEANVNVRPLNIYFSEDGIQWRTAASITSTTDPGLPLRVGIKTAQKARYIKIEAAGKSGLRLDEVEVYEP